MSKKSDYDVFLSYARNDDEPFVKQLYDDLSTSGLRVWWDRACMPNRALKFNQEIRDAVERSDRLLLIVGSHALASRYVRSEWQHALLFSKGVVPILRLGKRELLPNELHTDDYRLLPKELSKYHCPDFRDSKYYKKSFQELIRILSEPVPKLGSFLTSVPDLPKHYFPRQDDFDWLIHTVLADVERPGCIAPDKRTTVLLGMPGVGKSVMASAFARATETRRSFVDGVIWLTIGEKPDLLKNMKSVGIAFKDGKVYYQSQADATDRLPQVLEEKVSLIVLDDVWKVDHVTPFVNALGPRCRLLITTREKDLATVFGAGNRRIFQFSDAAAQRLLKAWAGRDIKHEDDEVVLEVAKECGNLPLALALCGALVSQGYSWYDLRDALKEADLTYIDVKLPNLSVHSSTLLCGKRQ